MMLRLASIFPVLLSVVGFVLSLLVLLAGKDTNTLTDVFVVRVNTTNIGQNIDLNSLRSRLGIDETPTDIDFIDDTLNDLTDGAEEVIGDVIDTVAHEVGLQDIYTAYVMTYCTGVVAATAEGNSTTTTGCTHPNIPFSFDPVESLRQDLVAGISLEDLGFPTDDIEAVFGALQTAFRAQAICYVIGIALAGLSIMFGLVAFTTSRVLEAVNCIVAIFSFLFLGIASGIATAIAVKGRDVINDHAQAIGVYAYLSIKFLGLTWGGVAAMLWAGSIWGAFCCTSRRTRRRSVDEGPLVEKPRRRRRYM